MARKYNATYHAAATRELVKPFEEELARQKIIVLAGAEMGFELKVRTQPEDNPLLAFLLHAKSKARHCKCGKLHCRRCGFLAFHARVHRISQNHRLTAGYLSGGELG